MPTKQVVLRASSAAAALFISNLSRCSAIGKAVRQASDDTFIQLGDTHIYPERDISAACDYGDAEGNLGTQASLIFGASDSFATKRIVCPKTDERNAFSASFGPRLHSFHEQGEEDLIFYETPPHNSGQDPVKDLDHSSYRERWEDFREKTSTFFYMSESVSDRTYRSWRQICLSIREVIRKRYGSFTNMCGEYYTIAKNAVEAANKEGWVVTRDEGTSYIAPGKLYAGGWGFHY